jgi:serine-type D-Ala-D-Ala carboxypeptidase/endopeptidase (penicillin-binding protein 4)
MPRASAPAVSCRRRAVSCLVALALILTACSAGDDVSSPEPEEPSAAQPLVQAPPLQPDAEPELPRFDPDGYVAPLAVSRLDDPPPPPASRDELERLARALTDGALDAAQGGSFSVLVVDEYGRDVLAHGADELLLPASTMKLVTAAAALATFGSQARFETRVETTAPIDANGRLDGQLLLVGSGDPVLATAEYGRWVYPARPRTPFEELADGLVASGLTRLDGDVIGVADRFAGPTVADGWPDRYFNSLDARYAGGLTIDGGLRTVLSCPEPEPEDDADDDADADAGEDAGDDAGTNDAVDEPVDESDEEAFNGTTIRAEEPCPELTRGPNALPSVTPIVRVDHAPDPAGNAAGELVRLLEERGVEVTGEGRAGAVEEQPIGRLARVESPPMEELLRFAVQRSDNHLTDGLFLAVGRARTGEGSFDSGERALQQVLQRLGIDTSGTVFADGSGLSREDRLSVRQLVELDRAMLDTRFGPTWLSLMAVTGESGTLQSRLANTVADGRFAGKTGTLRDTSALVGSVRAADGRRYHLGVISNDAGAGRWISRALIDELIQVFVADLDGCRVGEAGSAPGALGRPPVSVAC